MSDASKLALWRLVKSIIFTGGLVVILVWLGFVMRPSVGTTNGWPAITANPRQTDVLIVGTSRTYCAIMPPELWRTRGIAAANLTGPIQTMPITRAYVDQALHDQRPKLVVVDLCMLGKRDTLTLDTAHGNLDLMPFGLPKLRAVLTARKPSEWTELLLPLELYHTRWSELTDMDLDTDKHSRFAFARGAAYWPAVTPLEPGLVIDKIDAEQYRADLIEVRAMADSVERSGGRLVLYAAPNPRPQQIGGRPLMEQLRADLEAEHPRIGYLDMNASGFGLKLDAQRDYLDEHHVNHAGAVKTSRRLADYLAETYDIADRRDAPFAPRWRNSLIVYDREFPPARPLRAPEQPGSPQPE